MFGWDLSKLLLIKFEKKMYQTVGGSMENAVVPHKMQETVGKAFKFELKDGWMEELTRSLKKLWIQMFLANVN
jgi:hypothetical protein